MTEETAAELTGIAQAFDALALAATPAPTETPDLHHATQSGRASAFERAANILRERVAFARPNSFTA